MRPLGELGTAAALTLRQHPVRVHLALETSEERLTALAEVQLPGAGVPA